MCWRNRLSRQLRCDARAVQCLDICKISHQNSPRMPASSSLRRQDAMHALASVARGRLGGLTSSPGFYVPGSLVLAAATAYACRPRPRHLLRLIQLNEVSSTRDQECLSCSRGLVRLAVWWPPYLATSGANGMVQMSKTARNRLNAQSTNNVLHEPNGKFKKGHAKTLGRPRGNAASISTR